MFNLNEVVVVYGTGISRKRPTLAKVNKVTKTGQVETDGTGTYKFNADGSQRGRDNWGGLSIKLATKEDIQQITERTEVESLLSQIQSVKMESLNKDQLERILAVLKE